MFTFDTVVDNSVKAAKQFNSYVQDKTIRGNLDNLVDSGATYAKEAFATSTTYAKDVYATSQSLVKTFQENVKKIDMSKYFAK